MKKLGGCYKNKARTIIYGTVAFLFVLFKIGQINQRMNEQLELYMRSSEQKYFVCSPPASPPNKFGMAGVQAVSKAACSCLI